MYEGFDINADGSYNMWFGYMNRNFEEELDLAVGHMWAGFGERCVDDMLQLWLNVVYLDDAEFKRLVEERKAKPAQTTTAYQQP